MRRWTGDRFVGTLEDGEEPPLLDVASQPKVVVIAARSMSGSGSVVGPAIVVTSSPHDAEDLL